MEKYDVTIPLERYNELLANENLLQLTKEALFHKGIAIWNYSKTGVMYSPSEEIIKLLFPLEHKAILHKLEQGE